MTSSLVLISLLGRAREEGARLQRTNRQITSLKATKVDIIALKKGVRVDKNWNVKVRSRYYQYQVFFGSPQC